jgi:cell division protein ZapA (FtsZ GTPase activity inhibitor)
MAKKQPSDSSTTQTTTTRESDSVKVEIQGETIKVRSNRDPEFVRRLADYVDGKAEDIRDRAPKVPLKRRLLLVSMMVAEDFFETEADLKQLESQLDDKVSSMRSKMTQLKDAIEEPASEDDS